MQKADLITTAVAAAAFAGAVLLSPATARAQTQPAVTDYSTGFYIGGGLGKSDFEDVCNVPGGVVTSCDDEDTAWKVYGGMQINRWLAAELGYINFGKSEIGGTLAGVPFGGDTEIWGVTAHAVGMFPIPIGALDRFSILGKVGTIWYNRERETNLAALTGDDDGFAFAWGFGAQYTFSERVGLRAEWERFQDVGDSTSGEGDIDAWTISVNFKF